MHGQELNAKIFSHYLNLDIRESRTFTGFTQSRKQILHVIRMSNCLRDIAVIVDIDVVIELGLLNLDEIAPALFDRSHHRVVKLLLARLLLVESSLLTHWTAAETTCTVPKDQLIVFLRL